MIILLKRSDPRLNTFFLLQTNLFKEIDHKRGTLQTPRFFCFDSHLFICFAFCNHLRALTSPYQLIKCLLYFLLIFWIGQTQFEIARSMLTRIYDLP